MEKTTMDFALRVLPPGPGYWCHCENRPTGWINRPMPNVQDLVSAGLAAPAGVNTYFALSLFGELKPSNGGFRTVANAKLQKALWLDIDAKGRAGEYTDVQSAYNGLTSLMSDFPDPIINLSGQGLHVYWPLEEAIPTNEWLRLALSLKRTVADRGLLVDQHRTADAASVLRLPGTVNYAKNGQAYAVTNFSMGELVSVKTLETLLSPYLEEAPRRLVIPYSAPLSGGLMDNFISSVEYKPDPKPVIAGCQHIRECADLSYVQWFYAIQALSFCDDGQIIAHELSSKSDKYDASHVDKIFQESAKRRRSNPEYGPVTCAKFEAAEDMVTSGWCVSCLNRSHVKTPTSCKTRITAPPTKIHEECVPKSLPVEEEPELECFASDSHSVVPGVGIVWHKREELEDGDTGEMSFKSRDITISESELYLRHINLRDNCGHQTRAYVFLKRVPGRGDSEIIYDVEMDSGSLKKWLDNNGLTPLPKHRKPMEDFMNAYISKLQNIARMDEIYSSYGWHRVKNRRTGKEEDGFLIGRNMIMKDRVKRVPVDPILEQFDEREFTSSGCLSAWKEIADMYRVLDQKIGQLFICAAFAAPFMKFGVSDAKNIMFSLYDPYGGKGKTSLLRVVNSVWGSPGGLFCNSTDTVSARYQLMSARKHLPVCMDEISMIADKEAAQMLYTIASGREKRKSLPGGAGLMNTGDWQTVTFFSSNRSLYEIMESYSAQAAAPNMRVLEFKCDFDATTKQQLQYIDEQLSLTEMHHGLAGVEFIGRFLEHGDKARELLLSSALKLASRFRNGSQERFWAFGLGLSLAAGQMAKSFGLINYDIAALTVWVEEYLNTIMRREATGATSAGVAPAILRDFLNVQMESTLIVKSMERTEETKDPKSSSMAIDLDAYVIRNPRNRIAVRIEDDTQTCYFSVKAFQDYCKNNQLSWKILAGELWSSKTLLALDPVPYPLSKNVKSLGRGNTRCYVADLKKLEGVHVPGA